MATKTDIKFRLKPRWFIDHQTGEKVIDNENSLITIRITYESMRLEYSTGYHINAACWDANVNDNVKVYQKIIQKYTISTECCKGTKSLLYITYC